MTASHAQSDLCAKPPITSQLITIIHEQKLQTKETPPMKKTLHTFRHLAIAFILLPFAGSLSPVLYAQQPPAPAVEKC
jgi:hypothetical protein